MASTEPSDANANPNKRPAVSPLADETIKKHHGDYVDDDLLIHWGDQDDLEKGESELIIDQAAGQPEAGSNQAQAPTTMEAKIDKMLKLYLSLDDKIHRGNHLSQVRMANLKEAHNSLAKKVSAQQADIVERDIRINGLAGDLVETRNLLAETREELSHVKKELSQTRFVVGDVIATTGMLNSRIEYGEKVRLDQWAEIKEKKIILAGIPESKGESVKSVAVNNLKSVLEKSTEKQQTVGYKGPKFATSVESFSASAIDSAYRIGKYRKGAPPRGILVSFVKTDDRRLILKAKNSIKMGTDVNFYINEDQSVDTRNHRASIKRLSKSAKDTGLDSSTSGDKLIIDNKLFNSDELDLVPNRVLRSCAQEKWVTGGLAFRGERSVFSNFYTKPFFVDGYRYISVEQYFQYAKAVYFEDHNLARKIVMTSNPNKIQNLGDKIEIDEEDLDDWIEYSREVLDKGIFAKFSQNPSLKKDLLATGECKLYEATTDMNYACGINLVSKKWEDQSWEGQNLTGRALVEVRDRLRLDDIPDGDSVDICDASTISSSSSTSQGSNNEYRIAKRKSRAHQHSSATCYAMIRATRPIQATGQRPRPLLDCHVTGRSQTRDSNMYDQTIHMEEGDEITDLESNVSKRESLTVDARTDVGTTTEMDT